MDMIIAILVLAAAATVSFMSFITLRKQIEAIREENKTHWVAAEYLWEVQSNQISKEIQIGNEFNAKAFVALNENLTRCKTEIIYEIDECDNYSEKENIKLRKFIEESSIELAEKIDKSTRDINFITKQQAGRVITTPLKVMWEDKAEARSGN